jgi:hypothetical protein
VILYDIFEGTPIHYAAFAVLPGPAHRKSEILNSRASTCNKLGYLEGSVSLVLLQNGQEIFFREIVGSGHAFVGKHGGSLDLALARVLDGGGGSAFGGEHPLPIPQLLLLITLFSRTAIEDYFDSPNRKHRDSALLHRTW